jgi:LCP family protein required for cell wall assembly
VSVEEGESVEPEAPVDDTVPVETTVRVDQDVPAETVEVPVEPHEASIDADDVPSDDEVEEAPAPEPSRSLSSSRSAAAFFSFLIPGTGQYLTGRPAIGALFLVPLVAAAVGGIVVAGGDPGEAVGIMLQPTVLLGIVVADGVLLVWRLVAIVDAWWHVGPNVPRSDLSMVVLAILLSLTVATHMFVGVEVLAVRDTVETVFASSDDQDDGFGALPSATPSPSATLAPTATPRNVPGVVQTATPTPSPSPTPSPTPRPGPLLDGRLDLLLVGADAGPGRWSLRTDTLVVLSVDQKSGEAAIFSIPRNMVNVPLPKESRGAFACRCYPQLINSLYVYASAHPSRFPGKDSVRGLRAVQMAIGELIDRKLDGMVVIKLQGFVRLVDAIGGIDITVPRSVFDRRYPLESGRGYVKVFIRAGKQHMDGHKALIYARSRHQDSDYGRMGRQQLVISAIGKKLLKGDLVDKLPKLLKIAKDNLWTNLKTDDLPALAQLAEQADLKGMQTTRFIPPTYREFLDRASIKRIRSVVKHVFDKAKPLVTPAPIVVPTRLAPPGY